LYIEKAIVGMTFILTLLSVLFYHRGVLTRLAPIMDSKYVGKVIEFIEIGNF